MDRSKIIERMKSKTTTIDQFNYDALSAPPLLSLLTYEDIEYFRRLATSIKYSAKIDYKYAEIDKVMKMRGFVKLGGGTNRVVYRHLELDTIVVKIAIDAVGIKDNPREYENQFYLKPYVTKVFEVSPCGTVGLFERCDQITSREEFESIASEVFDLLSNWIIGKYIMEDIGSEYFMNYCVRPGFGPVLCDFPYLYELDGNKLYCQIPDDNGFLCDGLIDYDEGFNHLYCSKCGAKYKAIELKKAIDNKLIISKEKENVKMRIVTKLGNKVLSVKDTTKETKKFEGRREKKYKKLKANNPVDSIRITTTKQKEEEKVVTKVGDCEVVNQICTEIPENNITQCNDVKEEPKIEEFLDKEEISEYEIDCIGKPVEVDYFECIKDYKDSDGDSTTVFYRDYHGTDEGTIDDIVDIYFERWCDIKDEITHNDEDTYNLTISTEIAVYDEYFKQELSDTADMHGEDCLLVEGGENYNLSKEDYENVYKIVEDVRDDILNYINNDEFIIEISIKINSKSYNKLDLGEDVDEVKDICVNTIDYIQESILEKHGYDNMDIRIELTISEKYDVDKFKAIYVNSDIDDNEEDVEEVKEDNTVEEIQNQESEIVEESQEAIEFKSDDMEEVVQEEEPEDAYENEQEDDNVVEETPDYSSSFIPAPKELPVGSTQVNNSYYNNNKKKNKHR